MYHLQSCIQFTDTWDNVDYVFNSTNEENLTPLDVAVLTNNIPMAKTLLSYGAKENPTCEYQFYVLGNILNIEVLRC